VIRSRFGVSMSEASTEHGLSDEAGDEACEKGDHQGARAAAKIRA
jgi:hypothetical protein